MCDTIYPHHGKVWKYEISWPFTFPMVLNLIKCASTCIHRNPSYCIIIIINFFCTMRCHNTDCINSQRHGQRGSYNSCSNSSLHAIATFWIESTTRLCQRTDLVSLCSRLGGLFSKRVALIMHYYNYSITASILDQYMHAVKFQLQCSFIITKVKCPFIRLDSSIIMAMH